MKDVPRSLRDFLTYLTTITGKSQRTREEYYYDLKFFLKFQRAVQLELDDYGEIPKLSIENMTIQEIEKITLDDLYYFMEYCERIKGNSPSTRARKTAAIKSFFRYLKNKKRLINENPAEELEMPKTKKRAPVYMDLKESQNLINVAAQSNPRNYAIIVLFLNLGIRVTELCNLNMRSVTNEFIRVIGKGDKERIVFLNDACREALAGYLPTRYEYTGNGVEPLFTTQKGTRMTRQGVAQLLEKLQKKARIEDKKITPHKLRHTSATLMYRAGTDIRTLQEILGHTNVGTTQIYAHIDNQSMKTAMVNNPLNTSK